MLSTPNSEENKNLNTNNREVMQKIIYPIIKVIQETRGFPIPKDYSDYQWLNQNNKYLVNSNKHC
jgi:hypothetical protein